MVFHTRMTTTSPCLHGPKKIQGHRFVFRILHICLFFHGSQTILKQLAPASANHRTAEQNQLCIWIFRFYELHKRYILANKSSTVKWWPLSYTVTTAKIIGAKRNAYYCRRVSGKIPTICATQLE